MALIDSLLRKKRLLLAQQLIRLHEALRRKESAARALSVAKHAHEDAERYLWQQLAPDVSLSVQLIAVAKAEEQRCEIQVREATARHQTCSAEHAALESAAARMQREIEKLEEVRATRLAARAHEQQAKEWQRLDEWVTSRHGAREL